MLLIALLCDLFTTPIYIVCSAFIPVIYTCLLSCCWLVCLFVCDWFRWQGEQARAKQARKFVVCVLLLFFWPKNRTRIFWVGGCFPKAERMGGGLPSDSARVN